MVGSNLTQIVNAAAGGDPAAAAQLLPLVYQELRKLAARRLGDESSGQTLQPTALVHEAYLRLVGVQDAQHWNGRGHFFAAAAEAMRRILIERARRNGRARHGGGRRRLDLDKLDPAQLHRAGPDDGQAEELLAVDEALTLLEADDAAAASVVKFRYFAGLTIKETADAMGVSVRTANRHWAYAKAWLYQQLGGRRNAGV